MSSSKDVKAARSAQSSWAEEQIGWALGPLSSLEFPGSRCHGSALTKER